MHNYPTKGIYLKRAIIVPEGIPYLIFGEEICLGEKM
jgi:hypothetical protein